MILKYTAGKCINDIFKKNLFKNNKITIINYISENNINHSNNVLNEYMKIIDKIDYRYMLALKLSSINFNDNYLDIIINKSINKNIRIIIDAEENKNISLYREIVNDKMLIHNKDKMKPMPPLPKIFLSYHIFIIVYIPTNEHERITHAYCNRSFGFRVC